MVFNSIKKLFSKKQEENMDQPTNGSGSDQPTGNNQSLPNIDQPLAVTPSLNTDDPAAPVDPAYPPTDNNSPLKPIPTATAEKTDQPAPTTADVATSSFTPSAEPTNTQPEPTSSVAAPASIPTPTSPTAPTAAPEPGKEIKVDSSQFEEPADPMAKFDNTNHTDQASPVQSPQNE